MDPATNSCTGPAPPSPSPSPPGPPPPPRPPVPAGTCSALMPGMSLVYNSPGRTWPKTDTADACEALCKANHTCTYGTWHDGMFVEVCARGGWPATARCAHLSRRVSSPPPHPSAGLARLARALHWPTTAPRPLLPLPQTPSFLSPPLHNQPNHYQPPRSQAREIRERVPLEDKRAVPPPSPGRAHLVSLQHDGHGLAHPGPASHFALLGPRNQVRTATP